MDGDAPLPSVDNILLLLVLVMVLVFSVPLNGELVVLLLLPAPCLLLLPAPCLLLLLGDDNDDLVSNIPMAPSLTVGSPG